MRTPPNFDPLRFARPSRVSKEARRLLVAEAAYYRGQRRGAASGDAIDDWLAAEQEVDARLLHQHSGRG